MKTTLELAKLMVGKGWFNSARLAEEAGISASYASKALINIVNGKRYITEHVDKPKRSVNLLNINIRDGEALCSESLIQMARERKARGFIAAPEMFSLRGKGL